MTATLAAIEAALPVGARHRQLPVRSLFVGIALALSDGRPAHLVRVHAALISLPETDQVRLGVLARWKGLAHSLTYRQLSYLFALVVALLAKEAPDGLAGNALQELIDVLLESSVPAEWKAASRSLAVDWTDYESFAKPPPKGAVGADPEAAWGHRRGGGPGEKSELFFGHFLSLATMVHDEQGPEVPELAREMTLSSCRHDPVPVQVRSLAHLVARGSLHLGDVLGDSGYAHRVPEHFALPLRAAGARLVLDLHPTDRGRRGTFAGTVLANGNCYCPAVPSALLELSPLAPSATRNDVARHDARCRELARYKLAPLTAPDGDGYQRIICPAVAGKLRCPLRPASMALDHTHPQVLAPPEHPPRCCTQRSLTLPPSVNAKTRQKHDYPSANWRRSFARRTAVERSNARVKDPATMDITKGWCRVMGLVGPTLFLAVGLATRNLALVDAFAARQEQDARRRANGGEPKRRRRRRTNLADLAATPSKS